ncbi:MAG: TetR/AcrR family transcriptional regulator [Nocardioidaceae bacterium]|nr:TetR/AcrR family transcriptional regulator [Nocardioidaceae bacterium]
MDVTPGLRDRKKARTRQRIADVAAELFASHGYDDVTMLDVARAAEVSDQTVYNYFAAKQELVLDRAEQFRDLYRRAVAGRGPGTSPAAALLPLVTADVERYRTGDVDVARGEFIAQSVESEVLRRFTLEERERQALVVAEAISATTPGLPPIIARAHAAALVAVVQALYDQIGSGILDRSDQERTADAILATLDVAFSSLDRSFDDLVAHATTSSD